MNIDTVNTCSGDHFSCSFEQPFLHEQPFVKKSIVSLTFCSTVGHSQSSPSVHPLFSGAGESTPGFHL